MQHWLETLLPDEAVWVISLDIALSKTHGDMTDPSNVAKWLCLLHSGQVVAVLAGPPCESWSAARHNRLDRSATRRPPRPIRSVDQPWSKDGVSWQERQQLNLASALLQTSLTFMATALQTGVSMFLEHPACATWRRASSIWRLPEVQELRQHAAAVTIHLDQRTTGAASRKPTTLLCAHLPEMAKEVASLPGRGRCCHPNGHTTALGVREDWSFRTSPLKEYPVRLCRQMAMAIATRADRLLARDATTDLPEEWATVYQPLDPFVDYAIGKDYARHHGR